MIERDGALISLWQDSVMPYVTRNKAPKNKKFDVIIVGGGITGISTALLLQKASIRTCVIESHHICFGTTSGTTAHLNTVMDTPYFKIQKNFGKEKAERVAQSAEKALHLIKSNISTYRINCGFENNEAYLFSANKEQTEELEQIGRACLEVNLDVDYVSNLPINLRFEKILEIRGQAKFHPVKYVHGLAAAFEEAGGVIIENNRVLNADENSEIKIETEQGDYFADCLIYATHVPPGVNFLSARCAPYRSYAMAVSWDDHPYPDGLVYDMEDPYHYYRTQSINGSKYFIIGGEDHKTGHDENPMNHFRNLESHVRANFHIDEIEYKWSSQYIESDDGLPYIGGFPGKNGKILVATGFGGNGMTYSSVAASVLKNILLNREDPLIKLYDPNRLKPIAGFSSFVKENVDSLKHFISKFFPKEKLHELAGLAPGEAKLVNYEKHVLALYKDSDGELHALNPVCSHMKCTVTWNNAENTWDCPCHGARYDIDGKVVTGPADFNLEKIVL
jgi:glycine/D-amino acid oxidase-like deaminating enzyme/nitrite reductase/ring-hydroxylating ferredoxin subunit